MTKRMLLAEFVGTAFLLIGVIGSGIMAERLSDDIGLQLLENAAATAGVLYMIIITFGPVSGAHFNPAVTIADAAMGDRSWGTVPGYVMAQVGGGAAGAVIANLMFDLDAVSWSTKERSGAGLWLGEVVATYGLVLMVLALVRTGRGHLAAGGVAAYIGGAYWFTSSTSFANPAVTITRTMSDTFAGIDPASMPVFVGMQLIGAAFAVASARLLFPSVPAPVVAPTTEI